MRLAALAIGAGVPGGDFAGTVEEVHTRACLIACLDDKLVTLLAPELGHLPCGITLDAPRELSLEGRFEVNAEIAVRGRILRIAGSAFSIDLRPSRTWNSDLGSLRLDLCRVSVLQAWQVARAALREDGRGHGLLRTAGSAIAALDAATGAFDTAAAHAAMSRLIGLGQGATPEGDDFLVGYFAALWACTCGMEPRTIFVSSLGASLTELSLRTHRVSRMYLDWAARGQVSERLFVLAARIAAGSGRHAVGLAAAAAMAVGHSSGACGVLGFVHGCAAWSPRRERMRQLPTLRPPVLV